MSEKYGPEAVAYATAVFGEPAPGVGHPWYRLLNAEALAANGVPVEYAAALPWEDSYGFQGYNYEDIHALYLAGVSAEWAAAFMKLLCDEDGRTSQGIKLHIDEMVYPIAVWRAGVEPGYAAACARRYISVEDTASLHAAVPYEYLGSVLL